MSTLLSDGSRVPGTNRNEALYRLGRLSAKFIVARRQASLRRKPAPDNHVRNVAARIKNKATKRAAHGERS